MSSTDDAALGWVILGILILLLIIGAVIGPCDGDSKSCREILFEQNNGIVLCQYVLQDEGSFVSNNDVTGTPPILFDPTVDVVDTPDHSTKKVKVLLRDEIIT